jgi:excisionase family DNA binding protein
VIALGSNDASSALLTVSQACARLLISKSLLRKQLARSRLPVVRIGRRLFIPQASCDRLIHLGTGPLDQHTRGVAR